MQLQLLTQKNQEKNESHTQMSIKELVENKITTPWHAYWLAEFYRFFLDLGIKKENLRLREHLKDELAHYAKACFDIEYNFPFGWKEIHGNADRGQFDLKQHIEFSKTSMEYFDEETKEKIIPYVASEPSQGIDRAFLTFIFDAYNDDKERGNIVLKLHPKLAPVKVGIFPLVKNKPEIVKLARNIYNELKKDLTCQYDHSASVGRRYARADEIGVPYCVTVDFDSLKDKCVTIRERDSTKQIRVGVNKLKEVTRKLLNNEIEFEKAGKLIN